ncbi:MAG: sterol-binding protein, partial [Gammaproteobacteria bacterium]|nr:sterol-binding protein [Gammaproteobacteria bacterium]
TLSDLKGRDAKLNGDLSTAEALADLLRLAIPDAESALADWIGDMPAHAVGEVSRGVFEFSRRAGRAFEQNVAEYLQEENPTLVPRVLVDRFIDEVDDARDRVERADKRLRLLEQRLRTEKER